MVCELYLRKNCYQKKGFREIDIYIKTCKTIEIFSKFFDSTLWVSFPQARDDDQTSMSHYFIRYCGYIWEKKYLFLLVHWELNKKSKLVLLPQKEELITFISRLG